MPRKRLESLEAEISEGVSLYGFLVVPLSRVDVLWSGARPTEAEQEMIIRNFARHFGWVVKISWNPMLACFRQGEKENA
jgi:hypothetical protein